MKIFLIGATGYIGRAAALQLLNRGHEVRAIALPPENEDYEAQRALLPHNLAFDFKDYNDLTDDELRGWFYECEGFVYAAGISKKPEDEADPLERILYIAKSCGVKRAVICGSYLSYFDKKWPHMQLAELHPYIKDLREQENLVLSFAGHGFNAAVLEFPVIFGVQQGCKSLWTDYVNIVQKIPIATLYPKGGTTMITLKQAACAIAGALVYNYADWNGTAKCWPIGCYNIPWREFFPVVHRSMDMPGRPIITIPNWPINLYLKYKERKLKKSGADIYENGINKIKFFDFTYADTYIDRTYGIIPLGVDDDDITSEIEASIRYTIGKPEKIINEENAVAAKEAENFNEYIKGETMKVFLIGGTGLLGSATAEELIKRGHEVRAIALPPVPEGAELPQAMQLEFKNYMTLSDDELRGYFSGCQGFVFASGIDERIKGPKPIFDYFNKYNVAPLERFLRIAKECGVKHSVICGSYFSYFDKLWPKLELSKWHPYIRSRREQERMALSFADENFSVAILELPYIFGTQTGREPVWTIIVKTVRGMPGNVTLYPKGGTTMVTRRQVAQAMAGALERTQGGKCWPIGYYNMPWTQLLSIAHKNMGMPKRKVITIPNWMLNMGIKAMEKKIFGEEDGTEPGTNLAKFAEIQSAKCYIDKEQACIPLGVTEDDIEGAIGESIRLACDVLDGKATNVIGMKGE